MPLDFDDADLPIEDEEYPDDDPFDDECDTVECPACGADVYEDAVACPVCGHFITHDTSIWTNRGWWWILLAALGIVAVILTSTIGFL